MVLLVSSFSYTKKAYKETLEQIYRNGLNIGRITTLSMMAFFLSTNLGNTATARYVL